MILVALDASVLINFLVIAKVGLLETASEQLVRTEDLGSALAPSQRQPVFERRLRPSRKLSLIQSVGR